MNMKKMYFYQLIKAVEFSCERERERLCLMVSFFNQRVSMQMQMQKLFSVMKERTKESASLSLSLSLVRQLRKRDCDSKSTTAV